jgi:citrate lyase beta subunit
MSSSLRVEPSWNALLYARQRLVHAAASAHVDIIDMPNFNLDDPVELTEEAQRALEIGFTGKCAIHPKQVAAINAVFTPSEEVAARAKQLIAKFEAQDQAFTIIDGIVMEKPVVERLYRTIAISERISR